MLIYMIKALLQIVEHKSHNNVETSKCRTFYSVQRLHLYAKSHDAQTNQYHEIFFYDTVPCHRIILFSCFISFFAI